MIQSQRRSRAKPVEPKRISLREWQEGKHSTRDSNRTPRNGLKTTLNTILKQDGTVSDRPSLVLSGTQPVGTVLGKVVEFTKRMAGVSENYEISVQLVAGVASCYYRKDQGTWILAPGKSFSTTAKCRFTPIRDTNAAFVDEDKVLITNQVDTLAYLDINTLTVVPFTALAAAATPVLSVGAGIVGTNFPQRYRVTAGNRGETAASVAATVNTSKQRSEWTAITEYIDVTITRVVNAQRYHIYYGTETGQEVYLFSIDDPGSGATVTFRDTGQITPNIYRPAPTGDTTPGPICADASFINGQVFLVRDKVNPKYVRFGGTQAGSILDFSPYGGGGYEPVGGNKEVPVKVAAFRANSGTPAITVLCKGTNGLGKRYIFTPQTTGNISFFAISEENGNDGTEAPDTVVLVKDQLWYLSKEEAKTTLTKAQIQTILSTESVSEKIQKDFDRLNSLTLEKACAVPYKNYIYFAVAVGTQENNQIWVLDLNDTRRGAWMLPWEVAAEWMWLYNDNFGVTHFCVLQNNQVMEFTDSASTSDNGVAFPTGMGTGLIGFSEDFQEWAIVLLVTVVLQRPQGLVTVTVNGKTEDAPLAALGSVPFTAETDVVGWSENGWSEIGWSEIGRIPQSFGIERTEIPVEIDEELQWLSVDVGSTNANVSYEVTDVILDIIPTGIKRQ